jgi:hypothetical protein
MLDLNPEIENREEYMLDAEFNNASIVQTKWVGRIYALVTDGKNEWAVVKDRLSKISANHNSDKKDD